MRQTWRASFMGVTLLMCSLILPLCTVARAATDDLETQRTAALARINQWRAAIGVAPMTRHPALDQSAQAHAMYYKLNGGGGSIHDEAPGNPGFTGADFMDRAQAAGYPSRDVNENMGLSGDQLTSLDWYINTINHRLTLLDPRYIHIGFGVVNDTVKVDVIDVGAPDWSTTATPTWEQWPPDGGTGVGTSFDGESPNAFKSASYPIGTPISLKYLGSGSVAFSSATITTNGQTVTSFAATGDGWLSRNTDLIATICPDAAGHELHGDRHRDGERAGLHAHLVFPNEGPERSGCGRAEYQKRRDAAYCTTDRGHHQHTDGHTDRNRNGRCDHGNCDSDGSCDDCDSDRDASRDTRGASVEHEPVASRSVAGAARFPGGTRATARRIPPPGGVNAATGVIGTAWSRGDGAVAANKVARSWLYGPDVVTTRSEPYAESPGGMRTVFYFDKARMELNNPTSGVSNGLLVTEMVSGGVQVGNSAFTSYHPATIPVAGDADNNSSLPDLRDALECRLIRRSGEGPARTEAAQPTGERNARWCRTYWR